MDTPRGGCSEYDVGPIHDMGDQQSGHQRQGISLDSQRGRGLGGFVVGDGGSSCLNATFSNLSNLKLFCNI